MFEFDCTHANRQHATSGQRLHQRTTLGNQTYGIFERHDTSQRRSNEFTHAMANQCGGAQSSRHPGTCQRVFEAESRRLSDLGLHQCSRIAIKHPGAQVEIGVPLQGREATVHGVTAFRDRLVKSAAHTRVLSPLAWKHENEVGLSRKGLTGVLARASRIAQRSDCLLRVRGNHKTAERKFPSAGVQGERGIGEVRVRVLRQVRSQTLNGGVQRWATAG